MYKITKIMILTVVFMFVFAQLSAAYEIPQRKIDLKPYLNFIFPSDLMESENIETAVENDMGFGFGIKARTQITGNYGFVINTSITDFKVSDNSLSTATIFTAGFYYSQSTSLGNLVLDLSSGVISLADYSMMLFLPSLEFNRAISDRISISAELGMPIPNDWFYNYNIKENYKSLSISLGSAIVF
ncbi:MAG: hypothetical protein GY839_10915 [candidate division Zixibacteria bacterium]|nr:hypothetical protein [candidate division Zixibacteria bacterium]